LKIANCKLITHSNKTNFEVENCKFEKKEKELNNKSEKWEMKIVD